MHLFFTFLPETVTMHRKDENLSKRFTPKIIMTFLWTEPMKIIKPVLLPKNTGFMLWNMIKNFTKSEIRWSVIFSESSVSEKFLHAMIN